MKVKSIIKKVNKILEKKSFSKIPDLVKLCNVCGIQKPHSEYYTFKSKKKDKTYICLRYSCKACHSLRSTIDVKKRALDFKLLKAIRLLQSHDYKVEYIHEAKRGHFHNPNDKGSTSLRSKYPTRTLENKKK